MIGEGAVPQSSAQARKLRRRLTDSLTEIVNIITHGTGLVVSVALLPMLVYTAMSRSDDARVVAGVAIFGLAQIAVYAASTMYHSRRPGPLRDRWRRLDQSAVYMLIAGTYTPFALGALRGPVGWTLLIVAWAVALTGIVIKVGLRIDKAALETATYLGMGWMSIVIIKPLVATIGWSGLAWIGAGGVFYTLGVLFLVNQHKWRFGHCVWHVAVLGGSACHIVAVVNYAF